MVSNFNAINYDVAKMRASCVRLIATSLVAMTLVIVSAAIKAARFQAGSEAVFRKCEKRLTFDVAGSLCELPGFLHQGTEFRLQPVML